MAEVYKRKGSPFWYAKLDDPKAPNGIRRYSTKSRKRAEAQEIARALQEEIDQQLLNDRLKTGLSISQAAEIYFADGELARTTLNNHTSMLNIVLRSSLGDFDMGTVTQEAIERFVQERRKSVIVPHNKLDAQSTRTVSDQTIRKFLGMLSKIYRFVKDKRAEGAPQHNPFLEYDRSHLGNTKIKDRQLRHATFQQILNDLTDPEHKRIIITLVGTGMRASELLTLKIPQMDFGDGYIHLGFEEDEATKTRRARSVPMLPSVRDTLLEQIAYLREAGEDHKTGYLFPSRHRDKDGRRSYRRYSLDYINKVVKQVIGISGYTNHRLRHTFASWSLQKDIDPITIKDLLGHRTLSTTIRYAHNIPDSVADKFRKTDLINPTQNATQNIRLQNKKSANPKRDQGVGEDLE